MLGRLVDDELGMI